jgi:hypothetical protein
VVLGHAGPQRLRSGWAQKDSGSLGCVRDDKKEGGGLGISLALRNPHLLGAMRPECGAGCGSIGGDSRVEALDVGRHSERKLL